MRGFRGWRVWVLAGVLGLLGCASPPSRFHTLDAVAERVAQPERPTTILVAQVGIPPRVDRRQLVLGVGRVTIEEFERWAAPLRDEIGRALALNLSRQLGASQVAAWPQNLIADPDLQVFADFARFESQQRFVGRHRGFCARTHFSSAVAGDYGLCKIHCLAASTADSWNCLISAETKWETRCSAMFPIEESVTSAIFLMCL